MEEQTIQWRHYSRPSGRVSNLGFGVQGSGFGVWGLGLRRGARPVLHLKRPHPPILKKKGGVGAFQRACVLIMNCFPAPLCGRRFLFFPPRAAFAGGPSLPFFLLGFRLAPLNSFFFFWTVFFFKGFVPRVFAGRTPENAAPSGESHDSGDRRIRGGQP